MTRLVDSHCHLQLDEFDVDRAEALDRAEAAGVTAIVCPATDAASCRRALTLVRSGAPIVVAAGIHPNAVSRVSAGEWARVVELVDAPEIVAIGETGLDYYRGVESAVEQRDSFARHLALAAERRLPVIVHNRQADDDVMSAIEGWRAGGADRTAILHCFVGSPELAARALALGCYLGFGGPVTFKSAEAMRAMAAGVPLDRMLVETDAPFLAPHPHRGQRNEPAHVRLVAERLAEVKAISLDELARATTENAARVFGDRLRLVRRSTARSAA